jgi:Integrase core domain
MAAPATGVRAPNRGLVDPPLFWLEAEVIAPDCELAATALAPDQAGQQRVSMLGRAVMSTSGNVAADHGADRLEPLPAHIPVVGIGLQRQPFVPRLAVDLHAHEIAEAFPWNEGPRYMIRDRDRIYGAVVTRRLRALGIRDKPIAPASSWQNGFAERLIGSVRRECLDHIIVLGEAHLRRILKSYARYYNETRTHLALDKDAPLSRTVKRAGRILCRPILGGLHHEYVRI